MSFFIRNKNRSNNKKKPIKNGPTPSGKRVLSSSSRTKSGPGRPDRRNKKSDEGMDEEILSDEFEDDDEKEMIDSDIEIDGPSSKKKAKREDDSDEGSDSDDAHETAQEKKIRLAKQYLAQLINHERDHREITGEDEDDVDDEAMAVHRSNMISSKLKDSVLEKSGQLHRKVADRYTLDQSAEIVTLKNGHRRSITACVVSFDGTHIFTASTDCNIIKWDRATGRRIKSIFGNHRCKTPDTFRGHAATITALAITSDYKFLASGDANRLIHIWRPTDMCHVHTFRGHRGPITALAFRRSFHQLFSASDDRMVKVWNLDEMAYVESLFGHHDTITAIDSFVRERAITAGGRDGTVRLWKIPEESHLIFLNNSGPTSNPNAKAKKGVVAEDSNSSIVDATIDCVSFIDETHFISGCDDGTFAVWAIFKKKPLCRIAGAHGTDRKWITAIAPLRNTDLFATGSHNGKIIFWKASNEFRAVEKLFEYDVIGFVNSLEFTADGRFLVAAIGQEHRLGRWWRIKEARNCVHVIPLTIECSQD